MTSIYERFGVAPIINASGAVTRLGGAPMPECVIKSLSDAAAEAVSLEQLHAAASKRIARATDTDAGLVTAGSAASLTLGAAAILARYDLGRMESLPDCSGFPDQIVVAREQRSGYDHAVRAAGARLVEVGFNEITAGAGVRRTEAWEYQTAFGEATAGVLYVLAGDSAPPIREVVEVAHSANLPVLVDAAGELPPRENLKTIAASGADLVAFSGGKAIQGPQSTGILCGEKDLIASAALQMLDMDDHPQLWSPPADFIDRRCFKGVPRHGIGRAMKVSKEEIVALLVALERFERGDAEHELSEMQTQLESIVQATNHLPLTASLVESRAQRPPLLELRVQPNGPLNAFEICRQLRQGTPPIFVGHGKLAQDILQINPFCLSTGQSKEIGRRLQEVLLS